MFPSEPAAILVGELIEVSPTSNCVTGGPAVARATCRLTVDPPPLAVEANSNDPSVPATKSLRPERMTLPRFDGSGPQIPSTTARRSTLRLCNPRHKVEARGCPPGTTAVARRPRSGAGGGRQVGRPAGRDPRRGEADEERGGGRAWVRPQLHP